MARRRKRVIPSRIPVVRSVVVVRRPVPSLRRIRVIRQRVRAVEDRRVFNPDPHRFPQSLIKRPRLVLRDNARLLREARLRSMRTGKPVRLANWERPVMEVPKTVALCVRRKERREVIMALGRGNGGAKKRRNEWSNITC